MRAASGRSLVEENLHVADGSNPRVPALLAAEVKFFVRPRKGGQAFPFYTMAFAHRVARFILFSTAEKLKAPARVT